MNSLERPFVSVIIPAQNEEKYIGKCLESLVSQTYPKDRFEVLVIDGMSEDGTLNVVRSFIGKINLRVLENRKVKHVFALNQGIKEAKGDYFIVIGGHSFVEGDFIEKSVDVFFRVKEKEPKLAAVGGSLEVVYSNSFARLVSPLYSSPFSGGSSFWYSKNSHFASTVVFGFYDKGIVEKVGCFDEDMIKGQDFELNLRLVMKGYKLYCSPEIRAYYYARSSFSRFLKQSFDNGVVKGLCIRKGYFNIVWLVPLAFVLYQLLLFAGFFVESFGLLVALFIPFVAYWIVNALASLELFRKKRGSLFSPFVFWILHNITGIGFFAGVVLGKKALGYKR